MLRAIQRPPVGGRLVVPCADPMLDNLRQLAMQLLVQAVRDVKSRDPALQHAALSWLNSTEGRELGQLFGLKWAYSKRPITADTLSGRVRHTYFQGGN